MTNMLDWYAGIKILVIGDVMIDAYTKGVVERMSPEAPVPIVSQCSHFERLGGAANVALNLKALGADPMVYSIVGNDEAGKALLKLMQEQGLDVAGIISSNSRKTTVKRRILNGDNQLLRIDEEDTSDLLYTEYSILRLVIGEAIGKQKVNGVVFQDYNKGVLTEQLISDVIGWCHKKNIPMVVDPKKKNFFAYQGVTLFKPNAKELREGLDVTVETSEDLQQAMFTLQQRINCEYLMVTLSDKGVMMLHDGKFHHIPAFPRNIVDVSGAGDTVLSVAALCVATDAPAEAIATLSNIAGGLVCEELGVVPIDMKKFTEEVNRILS